MLITIDRMPIAANLTVVTFTAAIITTETGTVAIAITRETNVRSTCRNGSNTTGHFDAGSSTRAFAGITTFRGINCLISTAGSTPIFVIEDANSGS